MKKLDVRREENKYLLSFVEAEKLQKKLIKVLNIDSNSKKGEYKIRSLYFDSINNIDYNDKLCGREDRKKIRIRVYNPKSNKCKLEIKKKHGDLQNKISLWIKKEDAIKLINGEYNALYNYFDNEDAKYIYSVMTLGCYRPKVLIEYKRIAYIFNEFNTRLTFDFDIKSSESNFNIFDEEINYLNILNEDIILEVKYNEKLLEFISKILKDFNLKNISYSKYLYSRKIFNSFD